MAKAYLLYAASTVALLAAPAFAQNTAAGDASPTGASSTPPTAEEMPGHMEHKSAMAKHHHAATEMSKTDRSQDAAVDRLNEQSYEAAQRGQTFGAAAPSDPPMPASPNAPAGSSVPAGSSTGTPGTTSNDKM